MNKASIFVSLAVCLSMGAGCSTPVGEDFDRLIEWVEGLDDSARVGINVWAVDENIRNRLLGEYQDRPIGTVWCTEYDKDGNDVTGKTPGSQDTPDPTLGLEFVFVTIKMMVECTATFDYATCGDRFVNKPTGKFGGNDGSGGPYTRRCKMVWEPGRSPIEMSAQAQDKSPRQVLEESGLSPAEVEIDGGTLAFALRGKALEAGFVAFTMLIARRPPPVPFGALNQVLPGLCAQGVDWGCPDSPNYPRDNPDITIEEDADHAE